jgi:hypothetical protein
LTLVWLLVTKPHLLFKATTLPEKQVGVGVSPSHDEFFSIIPNRFSLTKVPFKNIFT